MKTKNAFILGIAASMFFVIVGLYHAGMKLLKIEQQTSNNEPSLKS